MDWNRAYYLIQIGAFTYNASLQWSFAISFIKAFQKILLYSSYYRQHNDRTKLTITVFSIMNRSWPGIFWK